MYMYAYTRLKLYMNSLLSVEAAIPENGTDAAEEHETNEDEDPTGRAKHDFLFILYRTQYTTHVRHVQFFIRRIYICRVFL